MASTRITIRDIAARAGLHFTTVSLALRDSPQLNIDTRARIKKLARDMGYRPDPMLSALQAHKRTRRNPHYQATIAWINNWPQRDDLLKIPEFHEYRRGAEERAAELGYLVEEFWTHDPATSPAKLRAILRARGIQALLVAPQPRPRTWLEFDYTDFSAIAFGYTLQPPLLHVVTNHQAHSVNLLLEKLWSLGYRRPGMYISRNWDEKVGYNWISGMMLSRWLHPTLARLPLVIDNAGRNTSAMAAWIKKHRPDVVITFSNNFVYLQGTGLRIPEDIGFASLNVGETDTHISGIRQNDRFIGRKAIDLLVDMVHRNERGIPEIPVRTLVEGVWCPGKTLRKPGASPAGRQTATHANRNPSRGGSPSARLSPNAPKPRRAD
ncbi:LacI family transcriptional regulator [Opitutaceae bacterium TAV5]|nr:LacI family transcriptional regulator [Opitutaceae bacterium TAV5]